MLKTYFGGITMENTKIIDIVAKCKTKQDMETTFSNLILKDKELLVETDGVGDTFVARFKVGDGRTPYNQLAYISNLYKLYPNFMLYDENYTFGVNIKLKPTNEE